MTDTRGLVCSTLLPILTAIVAVVAVGRTASAQAPTAPPAPHHASEPALEPGGALFGPYASTRESSGTAWQPDSSPMPGLHFGSARASLMVEGFFNAVYGDESGPRGGSSGYGLGMIMVAGRRSLANGAVGFRAMFTGEPAIGARGYPLLLQTGETADGLTPLVDRQHPHDFVMELAATWSRRFRSGNSVFVYAAPVGEPPVGPTAFMHRFSAFGSPLPPISHHFLDSSHITHGVVTVGFVTSRGVKLEVGAFNGHEPDPQRWGIQSPRLNSVAGRMTVNPHPNWSAQWSLAHLDKPEQLHGDLDMLRVTASVTYNKPFSAGNWQTTVAWGRNKRQTPPQGFTVSPGVTGDGHVHYILTPDGQVGRLATTQNAVLVESTARLRRLHTLFVRVERAQKDELFPPVDARHSVLYDVSRIAAGYVFDLPLGGPVRPGVGVGFSRAALPAGLEESYGPSPSGAQIFIRLRLGA